MICGEKTCQPATNGAVEQVKEADKEGDTTHLLLLQPLLANQADQPITDRFLEGHITTPGSLGPCVESFFGSGGKRSETPGLSLSLIACFCSVCPK